MARRTVRAIVSIALAVILGAVWSAALAAGGAPKAPEKYTTLCASCHGPEGKGDGPAAAPFKMMNPPVNVRNFTDGKYMNGKTDAHLIKVIKEGGPSVGLSPLMAPMGSQLSEKEIKEIIAFLRSVAVPKYEPKK